MLKDMDVDPDAEQGRSGVILDVVPPTTDIDWSLIL